MLEESTVANLKEFAKNRKIHIGDVVEIAANEYILREQTEIEKRRAALRDFLSHPFKLTPEQLIESMQSDMYDTDSD